MKKLSSFLITLLLILPLSVSAITNTPTDLDPSHPNYEAIMSLYTKGVVSGNPDGTYMADATIDRAAFTKIVVGAVFTQEEIDNCTDSPFEDSKDQWYTPYICLAEKNGIVSGHPDGTYRPGEDVQVSDGAKIIANAFNYSTQADSEIWYRPYVEKLEELKALPTTLTGFDHKLTRGEMAEMINRLMEEDVTKTTTTYQNLEQGIIVNEEKTQEETTEEKPSDQTLDVSQIYECENVKTVDFVVDEINGRYGSFTWTGKIVSSTEANMSGEEEAHFRLRVEDDGGAAFKHFKERALIMFNEGPYRYENNILDFALGSLHQEDNPEFNISAGDLASSAEIDEETQALILSKRDTGEDVTLHITVQAELAMGAAGLFAITEACSIESVN